MPGWATVSARTLPTRRVMTRMRQWGVWRFPHRSQLAGWVVRGASEPGGREGGESPAKHEPTVPYWLSYHEMRSVCGHYVWGRNMGYGTVGLVLPGDRRIFTVGENKTTLHRVFPPKRGLPFRTPKHPPSATGLIHLQVAFRVLISMAYSKFALGDLTCDN